MENIEKRYKNALLEFNYMYKEIMDKVDKLQDENLSPQYRIFLRKTLKEESPTYLRRKINLNLLYNIKRYQELLNPDEFEILNNWIYYYNFLYKKTEKYYINQIKKLYNMDVDEYILNDFPINDFLQKTFPNLYSPLRF